MEGGGACELIETVPRHRVRGDGLTPGLPQTLIHSVKESLVLLDRSAKCSAEVVAVKGRNALAGIVHTLVGAETIEIGRVQRIKIISRVQRAVAQVIIRVAVEAVSAALADDGRLSAH